MTMRQKSQLTYKNELKICTFVDQKISVLLKSEGIRCLSSDKLLKKGNFLDVFMVFVFSRILIFECRPCQEKNPWFWVRSIWDFFLGIEACDF